jgi:predicted nucleic acid-binding protein
MSYLLDTNVCIQYLACPGSLVTARMASMSRKLYFSNTMSGSLVVFLIYKLKTGKFKDKVQKVSVEVWNVTAEVLNVFDEAWRTIRW